MVKSLESQLQLGENMNQRSDRIQKQLETLMTALTELSIQVTHQKSTMEHTTSFLTKDSVRNAEDSNQQLEMDDITRFSKKATNGMSMIARQTKRIPMTEKSTRRLGSQP